MGKLVAACNDLQEMVDFILMVSVLYVILHWWKVMVN